MINQSRLSFSSAATLRNIVAVFLLSSSLVGCSLFNRTSTYEVLFELTLSSPMAIVHPGDALVIEAQLKSISEKKVVVRQLNADSLSFYWWSDKNPNRLIRRCVVSAKEDLTMMTDLPAEKELSRRFLFTTITQQEGTFYLQAIYETPVKGKRESPMVVSLPLKYEASGDRLFERGDDGLIVKEEAIRIVKEYLGRPTVSENAVLISNEAGFYDWWVTLTVVPDALAKGERPQKAYFVNPYLGVVRKEAKPNVKVKPEIEEPEKTQS